MKVLVQRSLTGIAFAAIMLAGIIIHQYVFATIFTFFLFFTLFEFYKISENILVGASYLVADEAADSLKSSTLGIEYAQSNGTYARLTGLFGSGDGADSDAYELAVGLRF